MKVLPAFAIINENYSQFKFLKWCYDQVYILVDQVNRKKFNRSDSNFIALNIKNLPGRPLYPSPPPSILIYLWTEINHTSIFKIHNLKKSGSTYPAHKKFPQTIPIRLVQWKISDKKLPTEQPRYAYNHIIQSEYKNKASHQRS